MLTVDRAIQLATAAHHGQRDKLGVDYIQHPLAVMRLAAASGYGHDHQIVAVLHDTVEDTTLTVADLSAVGCTSDQIAAVLSVTRRVTPEGSESYRDMIARAAQHDVGRIVKLFDNGHNSLPSRVSQLPPATRASMSRRYRAAREALFASEHSYLARASETARFPLTHDAFLDYVQHVLDVD